MATAPVISERFLREVFGAFDELADILGLMRGATIQQIVSAARDKILDKEREEKLKLLEALITSIDGADIQDLPNNAEEAIDYIVSAAEQAEISRRLINELGDVSQLTDKPSPELSDCVAGLISKYILARRAAALTEELDVRARKLLGQ